MPVFTKKPVDVEAQLVTPEEAGAIVDWINTLGAVEFPARVQYGPMGDLVGIDIATLEGTMRADIGDWVIRGVKGEFYPCKPDIFTETYDGPKQYLPSPDVLDWCVRAQSMTFDDAEADWIKAFVDSRIRF